MISFCLFFKAIDVPPSPKERERELVDNKSSLNFDSILTKIIISVVSIDKILGQKSMLLFHLIFMSCCLFSDAMSIVDLLIKMLM